jgi:formylglycine-generating enzyme required for sulfatase activity
VAAVLERVVLPGLRGLPAAHPGRSLEREAASLAGFLRGRRFLALNDPPEGVEILLIPPVAPGEKELDWSRPVPLGETLRRQEAIPLDPGSYVLLFRRSSPSRSLHLPFRVTRATDPQLMLACPVDPAALPEGMAYVEGTLEFAAGDPRFQESTRTATVPTFLLDEREVTNARYAEFLRSLPKDERARSVPRRLLTGEADRTAPLWNASGDGEWSFPEGTGDHPVTGVSLGDARAFSRWCGKRLPTPVEWERAARGADGRDYPFGDALDPRACNAQTGSIAAAGATEGDRSPFGVADMAGNVAEWTEDGTPGEFAVVKGGSYEMPRFHSMAAAFDRRRADLPHADVGFRCARSVE